MKNNDDLEKKFTEIVSLPDLDEDSDELENSIKQEFPELNSKSRRAVSNALYSRALTPEDVIEAEEIEQYNERISRNRDSKLKERELRREIKGRSNKNFKQKHRPRRNRSDEY